LHFPVAFRLYDTDGDGLLSASEVGRVLEVMAGQGVGRSQLSEVTNSLMEKWDSDGDGRLSFQDFEEMLQAVQIENRVSS
jgi:serine/threonine-protein phosphatase 2B regulatory subunit